MLGEEGTEASVARERAQTSADFFYLEGAVEFIRPA
jgi:hypothetical protein